MSDNPAEQVAENLFEAVMDADRQVRRDSLRTRLAAVRAGDEVIARFRIKSLFPRYLAGVYESPDAALVAYEDAARIVAARRTGGEG